MRCIVTAGPTYEPLDEVRRLTNFSTGSLGTRLADHLSAAGHDVVLLRGTYATAPAASVATDVRIFTTTDDLHHQLEGLRKQGADGVFHAAAVSDFGLGKVFVRTLSGELLPIHDASDRSAAGCRKLGTREGSLLAELVPTRKILPSLREWFPQAIIVGWKFELDRSREEAIQRGVEQLRDARTNACVVNGAANGEGFGVVTPDAAPVHLANAKELLETLAGLLQRPKNP